MTVPSIYGELRIDGAMALSKFEEEHRIVATAAAAFTVSNTGIVVRQHAWMVVSKIKSSERVEMGPIEAHSVPTSAAAVFQAFFSISSEKPESSSSLNVAALSDDKIKHVQGIVVEALGDHMRVHMTQFQSSLLSEAGSLAANLRDFKCPMPGCPC